METFGVNYSKQSNGDDPEILKLDWTCKKLHEWENFTLIRWTVFLKRTIKKGNLI